MHDVVFLAVYPDSEAPAPWEADALFYFNDGVCLPQQQLNLNLSTASHEKHTAVATFPPPPFVPFVRAVIPE